jgi:hypothetical protein
MTIYYRLDIYHDGAWRPRGTRFPFWGEAALCRAEMIADQEHCGHELIVKQGCRTRIVEVIVHQGCRTRIVEVNERVVQEFAGLPKKEKA